MMSGPQILWSIAFAAFLLTFLDSVVLSFPRSGYVRAATRPRVLLGLAEAGLIAAAVLHSRAHGTPIVPAGGPGGTSGAAATLVPWVGAILAVAGGGFAIWGKLRLGRFFTGNLGIKRGHELLTSGPYSLVRHPIYTGAVVFVLGTALARDRAAYLFLALGLLACFAVQARIEDRILAEHFGAAFARYRARVPGLLPWPRPQSRSRRSSGAARSREGDR